VPSNFHQLVAYQRAAALADDIYTEVARWRRLDRDTCGAQLVRAIDSVGANIAESAGRWHPREKRQLFIVARGSLYETEHWLERAQARGLVDSDLVARTDEIARALNGLIKKPTPG
jgi:four helix bundle protein